MKAKKFKAALERPPSKLGWTIVRIPFDVHKTWGVRGNMRVRGLINGFEFRAALFPKGDGTHSLLVNKAMQKGGHAVAGNIAEFQLEPDLEERPAVIPKELKAVLDQDKALRRWFDTLSTSMRRFFADMVSSSKNAAVRERRAEQVGEQIMSAMEGEIETPPILRLAFRQNPGAEEGWNLMTANQRRGQLLAIFYYRSPEARQKRVNKVVEAALAAAEKKRT